MLRRTAVLLALATLLACEKLDTQTNVLARNVIVERSSKSALTSNDAQSAFEELSLDLVATMVGTWNIVNKNIENEHAPTGQVRINADGTFTLLSGSFAAIGEGTGAFCDHVAGSERWEVLTPKVLVFRHTNQNVENRVIPMVVELHQDSIVFLGSGGCGQLGLQRVSILTRVPTPDAGP